MRYRSTLLLSSLVAGLFLAAVPAQAGPFTDVPTNHWAYEAIDMLQNEGIVEGYPDGTFKGNRSFTRYEMAMVVARLYTRLNTQADMSEYMTKDEFNEYKAMAQALMDEFRGDLDEVNGRIDDLSGRVDGLEDRVSDLESMTDTVTWSGSMRMRVEDIITGQDNGFNLSPGNPTTIPGPTLGQGPSVSAEFEQMLQLAVNAQP
ncbi:MAG: S-layer homology domain-containing protein, partial [bacterium]